MKHKKEKNYKRIILFSTLGIVLAAGGTVLGVTAYDDYNRIPVELKQKEFIFEYGEKISQEIDSYFKITDKDKLKDCSLKLAVPDKDTVETGSYKGKLTFRNQNISFKIKVQDTKPPEFVEFKDEVQSEINQSKEVLLTHYKADDLSGAAVDINDSQVNYAVPGRYPVTVKAADSHNNTIDRAATVEIKAPVAPAPAADTSETPKSSQSKRTSSKSITGSESSAKSSASASETVLSYPNITIPGVCSQIRLTPGHTQSAVDSNNIVIDDMIALKPGMGGAVLVYGHNTRSLKGLYRVSTGSVITIQYDGVSYRYRVTESVECRTSGSDLTNIHTGKDILDLGAKSEVLHIYTCYGSDNRWVVKAVRI